MCVCVLMWMQTVVLTRVKTLKWRIIQDSQGVLTHPSNTQGVTGRQAEV